MIDYEKILLVVLVLIATMSTTFAIALFDTPYIGNSNTMKFHYASCSSVDEMRVENQVLLATRDEAIQKKFCTL